MGENKKRYAFYGMLALCAATVVLRCVDLHFYTDPATGFATAGSMWYRYLPLLLAAVLSYVVSRFAAVRPRELLHRCTPLGICMLLTATALAAVGLADISPLLARGATPVQYADCLVPLLAAVWFWRFSAKAFAGPTGRGGELPSAVSSIFPLAYYAWLLIHRFAVAPAALVRIGSTLRVLSAAAALLFILPLLKVFVAPGSAYGRAMFATGINVFLLGNCAELIQVAYEIRHGLAGVDALLESLSVVSLGLCGVVCAWYAVGTDLEKLRKEKETKEIKEAAKDAAKNEKKNAEDPTESKHDSSC